MTKFINGRGQLGKHLLYQCDKIKDNPLIYHTWDVVEKSRKSQEEQYLKFKNFVDDNVDEKIVFISTRSQKETWYTYYKQLSEAYLLTKCEKGIVIRLPTFVGKPSKLFLINEDVKTYGHVELISLEKAANKIVEICNRDTILKVIDVKGEMVSASLVREIVKVAR